MGMISRYYDLFLNLFYKEIKVRYMGSWLGFFWSLLPPVFFAFFYGFLFSKIIPLRGGGGWGIVTGFVHWYFFSQVISQSCDVIVGNAWVLKKARIPKIIVNISAFSVNFAFWMILMLLYWVGYVFTMGFGSALFFYFLVLLMFVVFVFCVSLGVSLLYVSFRDLRYIVELLMQVMFWLSPVVYSWHVVPVHYHSLYLANPVAAFLVSIQELMLDRVVDPVHIGLCFVYTLLAVFVSGTLYRRMKDSLVEVL